MHQNNFTNETNIEIHLKSNPSNLMFQKHNYSLKKLVKLRILTPNSSKALNELGPFLALVCDNLQCGSKFLIAVGKPLQQRHALDQLVFLPRLETARNIQHDGLHTCNQ